MYTVMKSPFLPEGGREGEDEGEVLGPAVDERMHKSRLTLGHSLLLLLPLQGGREGGREERAV
jgi:hypothetical protein